jgi:hypothetical protein
MSDATKRSILRWIHIVFSRDYLQSLVAHTRWKVILLPASI